MQQIFGLLLSSSYFHNFRINVWKIWPRCECKLLVCLKVRNKLLESLQLKKNVKQRHNPQIDKANLQQHIKWILLLVNCKKTQSSIFEWVCSQIPLCHSYYTKVSPILQDKVWILFALKHFFFYLCSCNW